MTPWSGEAPEHACAILLDHRGWLLLQLRPRHLRHAPDQLCCFGGKREPGEDALACIRRELTEELGTTCGQAMADGVLLPAIDLYRGPRWIARFFTATVPAGVALVTEPAFVLIRAPWASLPGLPVSPWHRAALAAWAMGQTAVEV